jgi:hypothetical protein
MNNSGCIIELLRVLTSPPEPSQGFELPEIQFERHQQRKHRALLELARLRNDPTVRQMLSRITREMSPNGTIIVSELSGSLRDQVLQRVSEYAAILLSEILRAQGDESRVTNHEKFLREAGAVDPFLGPDVSLTRDSFAGRGKVEPDTWAEGANLERKR